MNGTLEQIEAVLRRQLSPLDDEADRLQNKLDVVNEQRHRLTAAVDAIAGGTTASTKSNRRGKPCATKKDVLQVVTELLRKHSNLAEADLMKLVKNRLSQQLGKSLSGVSLRMKEALRDERFELQDDRYRLRLNAKQDTSGAQ